MAGDAATRARGPRLRPSVDGAGFTTADLARRWRVSEDKVRKLIESGELVPLDTGKLTGLGRTRYVVLPEVVARFERKHQGAQPAPTPRRRRRQPTAVDFFPD